MKKCNFGERPTTAYSLEFGCPLDHCACGTHDVENKQHKCKIDDEYDDEIYAAELAAGWDANP